MSKGIRGDLLKSLKRAAAILVAALISLSYLPAAASADGSITLSLATQTPTVNPGDIVNININCDKFDSITEYGPVEVTYDPELFEFDHLVVPDVYQGYMVASDSDTPGLVTVSLAFVHDTNEDPELGVIPFYSDVPTMLFQVALRVRSDASGTSIVSIDSTGTFKKSDGSHVTAYTEADLSIVVALGVSTDATLSALSIEGVTLTPPFDPQVFEYSATVSRDVESVNVNATASNLQAIISVDGNDSLDTGENVVSVHVLAQDGIRWHEYRIYVNRQESYIPEGSGFVDSSGVTYTFLTFPANYDLPDGFMQTTRSINGYTVPVFAKEGIQSVLVYIYNGQDDPAFYFYNPITGATSVYDPDATVISVGQVLTTNEVPEGVDIPSGFTAGTKEINGSEMAGFINADDVFINYFTDDAGNSGFYMYDEEADRFYQMKTVERSAERVFRDLFYVFFIASVLQSIFIIVIIYVIRRVINNRTNPRPKRV